MKHTPLALGGTLLALTLSAWAQTAPAPVSHPLTLDVGLTYVTGNYGLSENTDVWVQTSAIKYEMDSWRFQALLPIVAIAGPSSIVGNVSRPNNSSAQGIGDVTLAATYLVPGAADGQSNFDFTGRIKLPTADDAKGLGTGKTDYYIEGNYHHTFGKIMPFATLGYRFLGRSAAYPVKDGCYATVGVARPMTERTTAGVALTWRERIVTDADDATEAMVFIAHQLDSDWRLQGFALTGFTDASPTLGLGISAAYKF